MGGIRGAIVSVFVVHSMLGAQAQPAIEPSPEQAVDIIAYGLTHYGCERFWKGGHPKNVTVRPDGIDVECSAPGVAPFGVRYIDTPGFKVERSIGMDSAIVRTTSGSDRTLDIYDEFGPALERAWAVAREHGPFAHERLAELGWRAKLMSSISAIECDKARGWIVPTPTYFAFDDGHLLVQCGRERPLMRIALRENLGAAVTEATSPYEGSWEISLQGPDGSPTRLIGHHMAQLEGAKRAFANLLGVAARPTPVESAAFAKVVEAYHAAVPRPQLPEHLRAKRIEAETDVRQGRLREAAEGFGAVLDAAPWWPQGRFNRALILAELGRHAEAIEEMKRYLALVPDTANARQAQDKVYEWEATARR
jgi:tetratricopeptide (TPR) repeat protein